MLEFKKKNFVKMILHKFRIPGRRGTKEGIKIQMPKRSSKGALKIVRSKKLNFRCNSIFVINLISRNCEFKNSG